MERIKQIAKDIRESLKTQHAYIIRDGKQARVYGARTTKDGALLVKIVIHNPGTLHHGSIAWVNVGMSDLVRIYAGTAMEEMLTVGI